MHLVDCSSSLRTCGDGIDCSRASGPALSLHMHEVQSAVRLLQELLGALGHMPLRSQVTHPPQYDVQDLSHCSLTGGAEGRAHHHGPDNVPGGDLEDQSPGHAGL